MKRYPVLLIGSLLILGPATARAQAADTVVDLDRLRADVKAHPDSFPLVFALGKTLARSATERSNDWPRRLEARKYLEQAMRMRRSDPRGQMEMGMLMRKQGMRVDGLRLMRRAANQRPTASTVPPQDLAEMHYQMGLVYETWWEDGEYVGQINPGFAVGSCPKIEQGIAREPSFQMAQGMLVLYNVACPNVFDDVMANWQPLDLYEDDYANMVAQFRESMRLDPTRTEAAFRLLQHMAAHDAWGEYLEVAEQLARQLPDDPQVLLFLGLGYHLTGRPGRADSAFTLALERATPALRDEWLNPAQLLRPHDSTTFLALNREKQTILGDVFWRARDPLFLTPGNERVAEHLARLAYVDVAYGTPQSGIPGRYTDKGSAWLRYGRPIRTRAIRLDLGALGIVKQEFWDYGAGSPDLVFESHRTFRWARSEELSAEYLRYARERVPELSAPAHPRIVARIPFQPAVFRDSSVAAVLEVYGSLPVAELRKATDAPQVETGVFVVTGDFWESRAAQRATRAITGADTLLDARIPLAPGSYVVSLEAVAGDVAAQRRLRVDVPRFDGTLALSDLLLVDRFDREDARNDDRAALAPVVSHTLLFRPDAPVGVLWEIYGLSTDSTGVAHYRIVAEVADEHLENVLARGLRAQAGDGSRQAGLEWDVRRVPRADGVVLEHVRLDLPGIKPGSYRVLITVTDLLSGRSFTAHRPLAITRD